MSRVIRAEDYAQFRKAAFGEFSDASGATRKAHDARVDVDALASDARQRGYHAGYKEGLQAGFTQALEERRAETEQEVTRLAQLAQSVTDAVAGLEAALSRQVLELATTIAREIIRSELTTHPDHLLAVVNEALRLTESEGAPVEVHVHPDDVARLEPLARSQSATREVRVAADTTLAPGDAKLVSMFGQLDASLATRWRNVMTNLGHDEPWLQPPPADDAANRT